MKDVFFIFVDHVKEIWDISHNKKVDVGIAYDMFRADVSNGEAIEHNSAMYDFDFKSLHDQFEPLSDEEKMQCYEHYHAFERPNYSTLCKLYTAGDYEGMKALADAYKAKCGVTEVEETTEAE